MSGVNEMNLGVVQTLLMTQWNISSTTINMAHSNDCNGSYLSLINFLTSVTYSDTVLYAERAWSCISNHL